MHTLVGEPRKAALRGGFRMGCRDEKTGSERCCIQAQELLGVRGESVFYERSISICIYSASAFEILVLILSFFLCFPVSECLGVE